MDLQDQRRETPMTSISPTRLLSGAAATLAPRATQGHLRRIAASAAHIFRTRSVVTGWTVTAATLAPALICIGWVVADTLQPPSYSPVRQSVSVLAGHAAHDRWLMTSAIFLAGCCYLVIGRDRYRCQPGTGPRLDAPTSGVDRAGCGNHRSVADLRRPGKTRAAS
jgi:hypothetical protein